MKPIILRIIFASLLFSFSSVASAADCSCSCVDGKNKLICESVSDNQVSCQVGAACPDLSPTQILEKDKDIELKRELAVIQFEAIRAIMSENETFDKNRLFRIEEIRVELGLDRDEKTFNQTFNRYYRLTYTREGRKILYEEFEELGIKLINFKRFSRLYKSFIGKRTLNDEFKELGIKPIGSLDFSIVQILEKEIDRLEIEEIVSPYDKNETVEEKYQRNVRIRKLEDDIDKQNKIDRDLDKLKRDVDRLERDLDKAEYNINKPKYCSRSYWSEIRKRTVSIRVPCRN